MENNIFSENISEWKNPVYFGIYLPKLNGWIKELSITTFGKQTKFSVTVSAHTPGLFPDKDKLISSLKSFLKEKRNDHSTVSSFTKAELVKFEAIPVFAEVLNYE